MLNMCLVINALMKLHDLCVIFAAWWRALLCCHVTMETQASASDTDIFIICRSVSAAMYSFLTHQVFSVQTTEMKRFGFFLKRFSNVPTSIMMN